MNTVRLVQFDAKGNETSRELTEDEMVTVDYDYDPESGEQVVFEVEAPPDASRPYSLRVNLNDGVSLLFDNSDDAAAWLADIGAAIKNAVRMRDQRLGRYYRPEPVMVELFDKPKAAG